MSDLALRNSTTIKTYDDLERAAAAMAKSGYFQDSREMAQAVVKILAGQEMGFGPFASMTGVYIISGRPSIGANLMAAAVKRSGRYNYQVIEMTEKNCVIDFYEAGKKIGTSSFSLDEARKAGTKNLDKYPRNMLFARAISNGCRWFCPDVFNGSAVYTPEELGANVNEDGDIIDIPSEPAKQPTAQQPQPVQPPTNGNGKHAEPDWDGAALLALATKYEQPKARILNMLSYCRLDKPSSPDELEQWVSNYRFHRDAGQDVPTSAAEANKLFGK